MRPRAIVCDFYGTLSVNAPKTARRAAVTRMAVALGVPAERFHRAIASTFTQRATGSCGDLEETMRWLASRCNHSPTAIQLAEACEIRRQTEDIFARSLREDAESTLAALRAAGFKIGLLSDCTHELPEIWPSLPVAPYVDATVFSVEVGLRKPHPDLYAMIASVLDVSPQECVYVGDGGSGELTGAAAAGMRAYRLVADDPTEGVVYDPDMRWNGATLRSLSDLVHAVKPSVV